jgi:hypothetical protein
MLQSELFSFDFSRKSDLFLCNKSHLQGGARYVVLTVLLLNACYYLTKSVLTFIHLLSLINFDIVEFVNSVLRFNRFKIHRCVAAQFLLLMLKDILFLVSEPEERNC